MSILSTLENIFIKVLRKNYNQIILQPINVSITETINDNISSWSASVKRYVDKENEIYEIFNSRADWNSGTHDNTQSSTDGFLHLGFNTGV